MWRRIFVLFFFLERITALEAPVDLATVDISTHSLSVMWRNLDGEANWFKATISPLDEGETTQGVKHVEGVQNCLLEYINESVVTWVDLVPGKNYTISVVAISGNGRISLATQIVASTKPMPPYRVRLSKFANRALSAHSFGTGRLMMFPVYGAVVYWDGPDSGHFDGYELTVNPPHGVVRYTRGNALINQAIRRRRIVWDLMPGVLYEFNVRTRSNNVLSDSSSVSDRMPPDTPGFISIDHLTSTTANLSWGEPHRGIYDGFVVEIDPVDGGVEQPGLPTDKRRNLFGLTPGVRYLVEVYATSHGVLSYKPRNRTIEVPPMPPMRPVVASNVQSTAVTLSWQVPVHGRLDHFEVVYYPTLNDYRRLRHKVHDPLVTLTNLLPNTEYSLILFSVTNHTNLVFSKPLLATVRTGQYETTAIYRTTTSLAGVVVTAKDEGEEEGNENLVGGTEDPAKTATQTSLIDRIKSDNGTTSNGGSEMTVGQDEGRTNRIQQGYSTICRPNNITVLVDKAVIANYERKYGPLHLNDELDPRCVGVEHPTYYRYTIAPNLMDCGTTIELNDTHVNFTNTVSNNKYRNEWYRNITDHGGTVILGNRAARNPGVFVNMRIWCTFPLDLSVSMAYPFLPQITQQVLTFNISGHGQFSAAMQLYKSNAYDDPYIAPPTLQSNETLYVGISLLETHNSTFMVVKRCWGTPERAHDHPRQYPIISDYCRVPESLGGSVKVMGNGEGRKVKWEGSVFKFIDFQQVWLHCEIRVCFGDDCKPDCEETTSRRKRSANSDGGSVHVISAGPISLDRPRGPVVESVASGTTTSPEAPAVDMEKTTVLIAVGGLCFVILICLIVIVGVLVRLHKKRRLQKNQNSSTESTTAFESRNFEAPVPDGSDYFEISRSTSHLQSFTPPPSSSGHGRVESSIRTVSQLKTVSNDNAAFLGSNSDTSSANKNINDKHNVAPNTNKTPGSGVTSHGANVIS